MPLIDWRVMACVYTRYAIIFTIERLVTQFWENKRKYPTESHTLVTIAPPPPSPNTTMMMMSLLLLHIMPRRSSAKQKTYSAWLAWLPAGKQQAAQRYVV